ncbi:MAG: GNAT family N-acetyltransferase [Chloroflexi bacterium]|nr:GNAT family N-acetyltransferase [Anaerolineaceae bacterium]NMB89516.1 GNAT family N-acetyltransferase [Chloroflexota bacterium]
MEFDIRPAHLEDAAGLAEILIQIGWFSALKDETPEQTRQRVARHLQMCLQDDSHTLYVAAEVRTGRLLGYVAVHWLPYLILSAPEGYVSELFVHPQTRGAGVGLRLLESVQEEALRRGCCRLSLLNFRNRESYQRGFYAKAGWEERPNAANFVYLVTEKT